MSKAVSPMTSVVIFSIVVRSVVTYTTDCVAIARTTFMTRGKFEFCIIFCCICLIFATSIFSFLSFDVCFLFGSWYLRRLDRLFFHFVLEKGNPHRSLICVVVAVAAAAAAAVAVMMMIASVV